MVKIVVTERHKIDRSSITKSYGPYCNEEDAHKALTKRGWFKSCTRPVYFNWGNGCLSAKLVKIKSDLLPIDKLPCCCSLRG